ncbi:MAG: ABC transporter permease [Actinomycetia bacterium]|nr:ABC transporter permease [Actinomycetes bacterium]
MNILRVMSYTVIVAVGQTLVLILGGLDLSVGSVIGLGGIVSAFCMVNLGLPVPVSIIAGLGAGCIIGLLNGLFVVKLRIPPLIVTLGTLYIARGIVNVITMGRPVYPLPESFGILGNGEIFSIQYSIVIMVVFALIIHFILKKTAFGKYIFAIGGSEETTRLYSINVNKVKFIVYIICGFLAAFSGIIMTSRMGSAQTNLGTGWELKVIAAVIIGGTSVLGGSGTILGTIIGAGVMSVLSNGMVLMRVSPYWQNIVIGMIIIFAVGLDMYKRKYKTGGVI